MQVYYAVVMSYGRDSFQLVSDPQDGECNATDGCLSMKVKADEDMRELDKLKDYSIAASFS